MAKQTIVMYPSPPTGHLISMVELGKVITKHHPSFSVTILITTPPFNIGTIPQHIYEIPKTHPSINFHYLPTFPLSSSIPASNGIGVLLELLLLNNPHVHEALLTISTSSMISAFVIDGFCSCSLEIANQLNIPAFYYITSGVSFLSLLLHTPTIHNNTTISFKDMNTVIDFPGLPPMPSSDMIQPLLDRTSKVYDMFLNICTSFPKARGLIVNTFESLEPRALKAITDGLSAPNGPTPPVYCIGPVISPSNQNASKPACLDWLDKQPRKSVVFLCFGSMGAFSKAQMKEIAMGLEKSGQRFLWVVRNQTDSDLDDILPPGFLERTKERGMIVNSWAPQEEVLSKESVGGFVTHCGWNSVLEAVIAGVPMVGWPLYAEQRLNRVLLVEEMKVALSMEERKDGFVTAEEVEKKVRGLMESEQGSVIRERVVKLSGEANGAITEAGSSVKALMNLVSGVLEAVK